MLDTIEYEERLCVFIDILGWRSAIKEKSAGNLYKIFKPFFIFRRIINNIKS